MTIVRFNTIAGREKIRQDMYARNKLKSPNDLTREVEIHNNYTDTEHTKGELEIVKVSDDPRSVRTARQKAEAIVRKREVMDREAEIQTELARTS